MASQPILQNDTYSIKAFCEFARQIAKRGDFERAEWYYKRALRIAENIYGRLHGEVGLILHNFADFYRESNRLADAARLELRIDEIICVYVNDQLDEVHPNDGRWLDRHLTQAI